jgi:hypothetical protein
MVGMVDFYIVQRSASNPHLAGRCRFRYPVVVKFLHNPKMVLLALVALIAVMFVVGCGKHLSGTFVAESTGAPIQVLSSVEFSSSGTAFVRVMGTDMAGKYRIEDNRVVLEMPSGSLVLTMTDNNTLEGNVGGFTTVLKRK